MNLQHSRSNPMRVPNWRWERARSIASGETAYSRKRDDPLVLKVSKFIRMLDMVELDDHLSLEKVEHKYPDLFWAYQIATDESEHMFLLREEIEARLCASQSITDISVLSGYDVASIQAFEQVFFNVHDRLRQETFFRTVVLGAKVHTGLHVDSDYGTLWKIFGYRGGPHVLNFIISTFNKAQRALSHDGVDSFVLDSIRDNMLRKLLLTIHTIRINNFSASDIMMNGLKMLETERAASTGKQSEATILHNIGMCLDQLDFSVGGVGGSRSKNDNKVVKLLDNMGIELPGRKTLAITASENPEELLQEYANVRFPEKGE